jgi:hypothetical protein
MDNVKWQKLLVDNEDENLKSEEDEFIFKKPRTVHRPNMAGLPPQQSNIDIGKEVKTNPCRIDVRYSFSKSLNTLNDILWRVKDELIHRELENKKGGHFGKKDWVRTKNTELLQELNNHLKKSMELMNSTHWHSHNITEDGIDIK